MWQAIFAHTIIGFIGLMFLQAGLAKWQQREEFGSIVAHYHIIPEQISLILGRWLPGLEIVLGLGLLSSSATAVGPILIWMAVGLLLLFAWAMAINLIRGRKQINCGCGIGGMNQDLSWGKVLGNMLLASPLALLNPFSITPSLGASLLGLAMGIAALLLFQSFLLLKESHHKLHLPPTPHD